MPEGINVSLSPYGFDIVGKKGDEAWLLNELALIRKIK
jgi:hypothetical protein